MIPFVGQQVLTEGIHSNGSTVHPAVITRVRSPGQSLAAGPVNVNLTVFPDLHPPVSRGTVPMCMSRMEALAAGGNLVAYPLEP